MPYNSGSYFAHTADVYAPDDAAQADGHMQRTTTDIQRLNPGSNVPPMPGAYNPLVAIAGVVAILALAHRFLGGSK